MLKRLSKLLKAAMAKFSISRENVRYTGYYSSLNICSDILLIDNCKSISDNPELLKELCNNPNYKALKKYIVVSDSEKIKVNNGIETVKSLSKKHLRLLASAGYIISDSMPDFYISKDEQIYISTFNGKEVGEELYDISLGQRDCLISSFIVCENEQVLDNIRARYMLDNLFCGNYLVGGVLSALAYALSGSADGVRAISSADYSDGRENVLIFTGALEKNGITTALKNLVNSVSDDRNYIPFFFEKSVLPNKESIKELGGKAFISITGNMNMTLFETLVLGLYFFNIKPFKNTEKILDRIYCRELKRCFGNMKIDHVIHFTGYARSVLQLICRMDAKKYVWVHNNMFLESKTKGNVHIDTVKYGYDKCDRIIVVRDTMKSELEAYVEPCQRDKITVVHNVNDVGAIRSKAECDIEFQDDTYCNVTVGELSSVLENDGVSKFINIARFSKEKGIDRLIRAFDRYRQECDSTAYLIIIGGYGEEFDSIRSMVSERENIILIKSIMNPYPILRQCDLFVLSSLYEGLPMTIIEALILGVPVVSTDITGPREFLSEGYGMLVDDSEQGVYDGLAAFKNNALCITSQFDADSFNNKALSEFNSIFTPLK